jgi:hypothetical protein
MAKNLFSNAHGNFVRALAALLTSAALVACGGGSGSSVVAKPGANLFTSAPAQVNLPSGTSSDFTIGGGGGGSNFVSYSATSSDPKVVAVTVVGTKMTIAGSGGGTATVNVSDSAGANVSIGVTVTVTPDARLAVNAPAVVTLSPGMTSQFKISGGKGAYTSASSSPRTVSAAIAAGFVTVTATNSGTGTVMVYDELGNSVKFDVTVTGGGLPVALYTTAPESIRLSKNDSSNFTVNGGMAPYTVTSSDTAIATGSINGNTLSIKASGAGRALINIRDAAGVLQVVTVNVNADFYVKLYSTAPANISIGLSIASTFTVEGGKAPFIASTSNANVARATITSGNILTITGTSAGVADLVVFDAEGASTMTRATVEGGTGVVPLYTTAPDSITVVAGASPTFTIAGGAAPYVVTSSNVAVATVSQSNREFTVTGMKSGLAVIAIHDANGTPVKISVQIP